MREILLVICLTIYILSHISHNLTFISQHLLFNLQYFKEFLSCFLYIYSNFPFYRVARQPCATHYIPCGTFFRHGYVTLPTASPTLRFFVLRLKSLRLLYATLYITLCFYLSVCNKTSSFAYRDSLLTLI